MLESIQPEGENELFHLDECLVVPQISAVEHQANEIGDEVIFVGTCILRKEVQIELFLVCCLTQFREHLVCSLSASLLQVIIAH